MYAELLCDFGVDVKYINSYFATPDNSLTEWEDQGTINGSTDPTSGFEKRSFTFTAAYSTMAKDWIVKASINHSPRSDGWGSNFPVTNIYSVELIHVIP